MPISRRQFFRGLVGQSEDRQRELQKRRSAVESYVATALLPYDFALTADQTAEALAAAVAGVDVDGNTDLFSSDGCQRLHEIVDTKVQLWREEYHRAEEARRDALSFVEEFLTLEATPEDLRKLGEHFQTLATGTLNEELERHLRVWLSDWPHSRLASCSRSELRELVFSEIRSKC